MKLNLITCELNNIISNIKNPLFFAAILNITLTLISFPIEANSHHLINDAKSHHQLKFVNQRTCIVNTEYGYLDNYDDRYEDISEHICGVFSRSGTRFALLQENEPCDKFCSVEHYSTTWLGFSSHYAIFPR